MTPKTVHFQFNGVAVTATQGQTIAAALIADGWKSLRKTRVKGKPRSIFCGIGVCFDCVVIVDTIANQRSCLIEVTNGMNVASQS